MKVTKRLFLLCIGIVVACQFDKEGTAVQQRGLESIEIVAEEPMDSSEIERISNELTQRTFSRIISRFSTRDATSFEGIWIEGKTPQKHGERQKWSFQGENELIIGERWGTYEVEMGTMDEFNFEFTDGTIDRGMIGSVLFEDEPELWDTPPVFQVMVCEDQIIFLIDYPQGFGTYELRLDAAEDAAWVNELLDSTAHEIFCLQKDPSMIRKEIDPMESFVYAFYDILEPGAINRNHRGLELADMTINFPDFFDGTYVSDCSRDPRRIPTIHISVVDGMPSFYSDMERPQVGTVIQIETRNNGDELFWTQEVTKSDASTSIDSSGFRAIGPSKISWQNFSLDVCGVSVDLRSAIPIHSCFTPNAYYSKTRIQELLNIHYPNKWMTELLEIEKTYTSEKSTHVYLEVQYVMDGFGSFINQEVLSISKSTGRIFSWEDRGISSVQWKHDVNEEWLYDLIGHHSEAYTLSRNSNDTDEHSIHMDTLEVEDELEFESIETGHDEVTEIIEVQEGETDEILNFSVVENKPVFPGCEKEPSEEAKFQCFQLSLMKFIGKNVDYPKMSQQMGVQGRVFVSFVIEKDGSLSNIEVARGVDKMLDRSAVDVVGKLPRLKPAKQSGRAVRMSYTVPINFRLQ